MSAFSFTAPTISPEEERREREELTLQERESLRRDIYGEPHDEIHETEEMVGNGVTLVRDALETMPDEEKLAYLEAVRRAPRVVEMETNYMSFLRHENYDPWAAAKGVVFYWKTRIQLFGPDRAFLPMTLAGAMVDEVMYLERAITFVLPKDDHGRPVFFWDRIRSTSPAAPRDHVARCWFYCFHKLAQQESAQLRGYVIMVQMRGYDLYKHYDRIQDKYLLSVIHANPIKMKAAHLCTGSGKSVVDLILPILKFVSGKHLRLRIVVHSGCNDEELKRRLGDYGLGSAHAQSVTLGGSLRNFEATKKYLEKHREEELMERAAEERA